MKERETIRQILDAANDRQTLTLLVKWTCKTTEWKPPAQSMSKLVLDLVAKLPEFDQHSKNPCADFHEPRPLMHVARLRDGRRFLVSTEGYTYARYIAWLPQDLTDAALEEYVAARRKPR